MKRPHRLTHALAVALLLAAPLLTAGVARAQTAHPDPRTVKGPFLPAWNSLKQYQCPDWFRDAKFGIWAHWTAQCVPEQGDWYARQMYQEGSGDYKFQVEHYGHPSKFGFKDIDNLWHAEHWNPEQLMQLYQKAGAKYFVALANHHDNFDTWNSKYQSWNSVNLGPHKDIVGTWAKAARAHGMRFGVTVHAARTWDWFDVSHGSDKAGPLAGVPYDGNLTKADGKGTWWDGYDPADLYGPAGAARTPAAHDAYEQKFTNRVMDLIGSYQPDLLYFDDGDPPTSHGLEIASAYYNANKAWHGGHLDAILNVKNSSLRVKQSMVEDYERGSSSEIAAYPWQTDTCIGQWHYDRSVYENHRYKTADQVVKMLVDIVSKNGNLLLNVPLRGDGTIDPDELAFLQGMAPWMDINGEAIYGTRPWVVAEEGTVKAKGGMFSEGEKQYTAQDFRFTKKGNTLYAVGLGWPTDGKYVIHSLAANAPGATGDIKKVQMLGSKEALKWTRDESGLSVTVPAKQPCLHAWALKITGLTLASFTPAVAVMAPPVDPIVRADTHGVLTLTAGQAALNGTGMQTQGSGADENIGFWDDPKETVSWTVEVPKPGTYTATARYASQAASEFIVATAGQELAGKVTGTGSWDTFAAVPLGAFEFKKAGRQTVAVRPRDAGTWKPINLANITLTPVK